MECKNLFIFVAELGSKLNPLYLNNHLGRMDILDFMDANDWFGMEYVMKENSPHMYVRDLKKLYNPLTLWLSAYRKPGCEKIVLMLEHFSGVYPETCRLYERFIANRKLCDEPAAWKLLDFMLSQIDRDITEYGEEDIEKLINKMDRETTRITAALFVEFLESASLTRFAYSFNVRDIPELINEAYPLEDFAVMAYCVWNEEMWEKQALIQKALQNKSFADLWLFVALHFICALRTSDMTRLPAPALPFSGEIILKKIASRAFTSQDASLLTHDLSIRLKLKPMKPSKTSRYEGAPELKIFVPESLNVPLGFIIAIVLAHHPEIHPGASFVKPTNNLVNMRKFFGERFIGAIGNRRFNSRRANKSYLQGIDILGDALGKPKGYMLASLARSHKRGIGSLSEITDIYLRDAKFSGYSPEFIISQMFERGVFGFIPAVLLEAYAGGEYIKLPVTAQTQLIREIGLPPHKIEWLAEATELAMIKSRKAVGKLLKSPMDIGVNISCILQNIASGNAPSRQNECLCLMTAIGFPCAFSERDSCIGCGYEIYTKTAMHTLMSEYASIVHIKNNAMPSEAQRYGKILEQAILPAVAQILTTMNFLYPEADMTEMLDIMERGIDLSDCNTDKNKRKLQAVYADSGN